MKNFKESHEPHYSPNIFEHFRINYENYCIKIIRICRKNLNNNSTAAVIVRLLIFFPASLCVAVALQMCQFKI